MAQLSLLGREAPDFDAAFAGLTREELGLGAWLDRAPGWLRGHATLFEALAERVSWAQTTQVLFDKEVVTPRLTAALTDLSAWPLLAAAAETLSRRYGERLLRVTLAYYRDGNDSVAFHRDRILRNRDSGLVATVSLGAPRTFLIRPYGGGVSRRFELGGGDLLVMGGTCQRTFEHGVPKRRRPMGARIAVMFRSVDVYAGT